MLPAVVLFLALPSFASDSFDNILESIRGNAAEFETALKTVKQNLPEKLPPILKQSYLDSRNAGERLRIIGMLGLYNPDEIQGIWHTFLRTTDEASEEIAILEILGRQNTDSSVEIVAEKLKVPRTEVREKAAQVLGKAGNDRVFPVILGMAESAAAVERIYFLQALKYLYDRRFFSTVISLMNDTEKSVRIYAIKCLTENDVREAVPYLRSLVLKDSNREVRIEGIRALSGFRDRRSSYILMKTIEENDPGIRLESIRALGSLKISSAAFSVSNMLQREKETNIKRALIDALISFGRGGGLRGLRHIIENEDDPDLRVRAVFALGDVKEEKNTGEILKAALDDSNYRVRAEACSALGKLRSSSISDILLRTIETEKSGYVRSAALYSLKGSERKKYIIPLFDIYSSEKDPLFREILRLFLRESISEVTR